MADRFMKVVVRPRSKSEERHHPLGRRARISPEALAPGFSPTPGEDLRFRGGHTIAQLKYVNFYVGGAGIWSQSDVDSIDTALARAMSDERLNNVMRQYFANQPITTTFLGSRFTGTKRPRKVSEASVHRLIKALFAAGQLSGLDFPTTVVNVMLPSRTVLTLGNGAQQTVRGGDDRVPHAAGVPESEEDSSLNGLGGYHGHVAAVGGRRIYFAVGVFSQRLPNGGENGIAVFEIPWKNVVATFYHELNEARTDPDVDEAIATGRVEGVIGWNSDTGQECGDFPIVEAEDLGDLQFVFQEVPVAGGTAPVQFEYSNAVHGPEGPIAAPHAVHAAQEIEEEASVL
jgi:hypothetical protein